VHVVVCPDSFKGSLTAAAAAAAIGTGWRRARPDDSIDVVPIADGGEGTLGCLLAARADAARIDVGDCTGPTGERVPGWFVALPGDVALVELAVTSGLPLATGRDPLNATSRGVGDVIARALDAGARHVVVALGGSASTDAGAGLLRALGARLVDAHGDEIADGGGALLDAVAADLTSLREIPNGVEVLVDVDAPLLGPRGAAAVFAPQKGATAAEVVTLERALRHWAGLLGGDPTTPGAGAAGGCAYGLHAAYGAPLRSGSSWVTDVVGLRDRIAAADLVITGEGRLDATSFGGKAVGTVAAMASADGVRVGVICGDIDAGLGRDHVASFAFVATAAAAAGSTERALDAASAHVAGAAELAARAFR
jgi:glycerate kinase